MSDYLKDSTRAADKKVEQNRFNLMGSRTHLYDNVMGGVKFTSQLNRTLQYILKYIYPIPILCAIVPLLHVSN